MKNLDKFIKIQNALKNTIIAKNNSTDFLYHLKREFSNYKDIKKHFNNIFDKEFLKNVGILKEEKSEVDKRKVEYRLDELHKLYKEYTDICKSLTNLNNCHGIIKTIIANAFIESYFEYDYNILKKTKKELNNVFVSKEKTRDMLRFISFPIEFNMEHMLFSIVEKSVDVNKLNKEIAVVITLIKLI